MQDLLNSVDAEALSERQAAILRLISRGGSAEIARVLAALTLLTERVQQESEINRRSLEFINIPIAKSLLDSRTLSRSVRLNAELPYDRTAGLHGLEHTVEGLPFRWTGPTSQSCFEIQVDRTVKCKASFRLISAGHLTQSYLNSIQIYVDGQSRPKQSKIGEFVQLEFELPERTGNIAGTLIVLECPVWSPVDALGTATDTRRLGVQFFDLAVEALAQSGP